MDKKDKSVLDGMTVKEHGFPMGGAASQQTLEIIGCCPDCNSPIYGPRVISATETPVVKYTCGCKHKTQHNPKNFGDTVCTK